MNRENVHGLDLEKIAFRMRDKEFFTAAIKVLDVGIAAAEAQKSVMECRGRKKGE